MENEVIRCIKGRRSIREYSQKEVSKECIEEIISAGKYAPSAENRQPWKFIVITNKKLLNTLSSEIKKQIKCAMNQKWKLKRKFSELKDKEILIFLNAISSSKEDLIFHNSPVVIFIITKDNVFNDESCSCAAQNMMLAAWALNIGSCWIGFAKFLELNKEIMKAIGIPDTYHIASCLIFGYAVNVPKPEIRNPLSEVIKWIE